MKPPSRLDSEREPTPSKMPIEGYLKSNGQLSVLYPDTEDSPHIQQSITRVQREFIQKCFATTLQHSKTEHNQDNPDMEIFQCMATFNQNPEHISITDKKSATYFHFYVTVTLTKYGSDLELFQIHIDAPTLRNKHENDSSLYSLQVIKDADGYTVTSTDIYLLNPDGTPINETQTYQNQAETVGEFFSLS